MSTIKSDYYELLKPLVYSITGIEEDSKEFKDITKKLVEKIRFNTYTVASQKYVKHTYEGIIEKFKISAQEKSAEDLSKFLNILEKKTEQKKNSKIPEILTLFIILSKSPTHHFYNSHYFDVKEEIKEKELTWKDILKDDPLTGDYWKIPNYASDSSSDTDTQYSDTESNNYSINSNNNSFNLKNNDKNEISFLKKDLLTKKIDSLSSIGTTNNSINFNNNNNNDETLHFNDNFGESQYWNHINNLSTQDLNTKFDISNPYTLDMGIIQGIKENSKILPDILLKTNYVSEGDIVREILFMLLGLDTAFFKYDKYNSVEVNQNLSLKHLTSSCISQLINYFTDKGSKIKDLRLFVK
eukprot:jgi/Orpsp1_1/1181148/evm.model.c7180000076085.1